MALFPKKDIRVEIYGRNYTLLGDAGEEYTMQLAKYVDQKMREISQETSTISTLNLAILVALNITDELFHLREQIKSSDNALQEKLSDVLTKLDNLPHP